MPGHLRPRPLLLRNPLPRPGSLRGKRCRGATARPSPPIAPPGPGGSTPTRRSRRPPNGSSANGFPVPDVAKKLIIRTGKNAGKHPSAASLYWSLAEAEAAAVDDGLPLRPKPVRIRRPGEPLTPEEIDLRERLQAQPHPNAEPR